MCEAYYVSYTNFYSQLLPQETNRSCRLLLHERLRRRRQTEVVAIWVPHCLVFLPSALRSSSRKGNNFAGKEAQCDILCLK